jgi:hypothetical protein
MLNLASKDLARERLMTGVVDRIDGWLDRFTAKRTFDILQTQEQFLVAGALYEVGLFHGKYFSLLIDSGIRSGDRVLGIDTFEYVPESTFRSEIEDILSNYYGVSAKLDTFNVKILAQPSSDIGAADLQHHLGGHARFISVDGSHEYLDVLWDLGIARQMLAPGGIIAVDDYLHPISLGVTAATDRFLMGCDDLAPFAYIANKLFLARPSWADRYRQAMELAIIADLIDDKSRAFRAHLECGKAARVNVEANYSGYRVLTVAL